jgi:hypothetical protein
VKPRGKKAISGTLETGGDAASSGAGLMVAGAEAQAGRGVNGAPAHFEDDAWLAMVAADPALYLKDTGTEVRGT